MAPPARALLALATLVGSLAGATPTVEPDPTLRRLAAEAGQKEPLVRIGLPPAHRVQISSSRPFRLLDPGDLRAPWKETFVETIQVVAEGGPTGEVPSVYRIQVGAFSRREAAEAEARRLEAEAKAPAMVRHDPDRATWRVRLGEERDRLALNPLMDRLRAMGLENLWIAEEPARAVEGVSLRLVDESWDSLATGLQRLVVVPHDDAYVEVDETPYRGLVELRISPFGTVRAVNWVGLESYLLGVVPAELGPEVWPELEALRAQAVAARTYIWRNLGQFEEEGFDICATPRCQVYGGKKAEHPLSDRAVWKTRGEILAYEGEPIDALYTATCGGHTENGGLIFPDQDRPYLAGVPCRAEEDALATQHGTVAGRKIPPVRDETGADVTRDWALLQAVGVISAADGPETAARAVDPDTLRHWTRRLAAVAGLPAPAGDPHSTATLGQAARAILADLGWDERAEVLLSAEDVPALLRDPEAGELPFGEQRALAYLAWTEALRPFPDGRYRVGEPATRARLARALATIADAYEAFALRRGTVVAVRPGRLRLVEGKGELRLAIATEPALFGRMAGRAVPVRDLRLWPSDRVRFRIGPDGRVDFLELDRPVKGVSDDRSAVLYSWEVRRSARQLEAAVNRRVSIGRLLDLEVVSRGVSGRIVALRVVGSRGSTVVRGFDVRRLLDLRESLTVVELQRDSEGRIRAAVFAGKGWGHGVGLCQVGAYGMALRGADYREILAHYYRGSEVRKAALARPGPPERP